MAYKKYIKKNGKLYGPYTYHSRRVNGKVVSEYYGPKPAGGNKKSWLLVFATLVVLALGFYAVNNSNLIGTITGDVALDVESTYVEGQPLSGFLRVTLNEGEFLPASSKFLVSSPNTSREYVLSEIVSSEASQGEFYIEDRDINGSGEGYGIEGSRESYPEVNFVLEIFSSNSSEQEEVPEESSEDSSDVPDVPEESNESSGENSSNETESSDGSSSIDSNETEISSDSEEESNDSEDNSVTEEPQNDESSGEDSQGNNPENAEQENSENEESDNGESINEDSSDASSDSETSEESSGSEEQPEEPSENSNGNSNQGNAPVTGAVVSGNSGLFANVFGFMEGIFNPTGGVVVEISNEVEGSVSGGETYTYNLSEGQDARLKSGSATSGGESIDDSYVDVSVEDGQVEVTSSYTETESGFGEEYVGSEAEEINVDLGSLNLSSEKGEWEFEFEYDNVSILSTSLEFSESNQTVSSNTTTANLTEINQTINQTNFNITFTDVTLSDEEKSVLRDEFGNKTVNVDSAEESGDRISVKLSLEDYWVEYTYDSSLSNEELNEKIDSDRIKWLKDLAKSLSENNTESEVRDDLIQNYSI